ncbi:MAG TPA: FimV/HubP family polar landmark protein, partial [Burkholderiales bacterium]|nr:FimV/HubP family polar landmark protein [Burkholderiales bacterium]
AKGEAPKPATKPAAKAPAKKGPPPPEPSIIDEFLDNPLYLGLLGGVIVLLAGYGWWTWRRKKAAQSRFQSSVLGASSAAGPGTPSVLGAPAAAATTGAAPASASQPSQPPAIAEPEEVDPIAEADVYMAYGRDAQAEEILKEALQKDGSRVAVHAKLLEIYANRKDAKSFEQTALKLKGLTNGAGPEWEKAAALGRSIDPQNGIYAGTAGAAPAAPVAAAPAAPAAAPTLDFDLGGASSQAASPDITLDGGAKEGASAALDFDLGGGTTPPAPSPAAPAPAPEKDFTPDGTVIMSAQPADQTAGGAGGGLDFDLGLGDTKAAAPAPAPAAPAAPAAPPAESGGLDFDLNLDIGGGGEKPAAAAPAEPSAAALDLSSISLDLGEPAAAPAAGSGDPKWQEVATKLDLAKAYEEMGDKDGARELLNEVMKDGDAAQKGQAEQLLAKLA